VNAVDPGLLISNLAEFLELSDALQSTAALAPLAHDVMHVELALDDGQTITYETGQYINVVLDDGARRSYSFTEPSATTRR
jgi:ferredoxin-NADP reductase